MNELEELRAIMVAAFRRYSAHDPSTRWHLWEAYVSAREAFLKLATGMDYQPLRAEQYHH